MNAGMIRSALITLVLVLCLAAQAAGYTVQELGSIPLSDRTSAIAFDPVSGSAAAAAGDQRGIILINAATGQTRTVPLDVRPTALAFDPSANRLIAGSAEGDILFIDSKTGTVTGGMTYAQGITALGVNTDTGLLIAGTDSGLAAFDTNTQTVRTEVPLTKPVTALAVDQKNGWLFILQEGVEGISVRHASTLEHLASSGAGAHYSSVDVNPSTGIALAANEPARTLSLFRISTDSSGSPSLNALTAISRTAEPSALAIDRDMNIAYIGTGQGIEIIRLENPVPRIDSLVPDSARAGDNGFTLSIRGERFLGDSQARFNSRETDTGFESTESLQTVIPSEYLLRPGNVPVTVTNPPPGGGVSNTCNFRIYNPAPVLESITPDRIAAETERALRVRGRNFFNGSVVNLNGENLRTRFISSILLEADVDRTHTAKTGEFPVVVINPMPGGFTSNAKTLHVTDPTDVTVQSATLIEETQKKGKEKGSGSLRGRIVNTQLEPLAGVTVSAKGMKTLTDENGSFLLENIPAGRRVVLIDGDTEKKKAHHYPTIPLTIDIEENTVNDMPFQIYLHKQKNRNFRNITPGDDTVLTDPELPEFEMRIPKGVGITGWDGKKNQKVSVRTVPPDRLPIKPLPRDANVRTVYMFYFSKIGGGTPDQPVPIKSRNDLGLLPGEKAVLWYYDESPNEGEAPNDWAIAGTGTVTPDGKYIVSDPGVGIPKFCCGATAWGGQSASTEASAAGAGTGCPSTEGAPEPKPTAGDPVDLATGYFIHNHADLLLPGSMPISVTRYYRGKDRSGNEPVGSFGRNTYFEYDWWLGTYTDMLLLVMPGNEQYRYYRQPNGTYINEKDPAARGDVITVSGSIKTLRKRNGSKYSFDASGRLTSLTDRNGNSLTFARRSDYEGGYLTTITNPEGRTVTFNQVYTGNFFRTDSIIDNTGRTVTYTYDTYNGYPRLTKVTYWDGSTLEYGYDGSGRMNTVKKNGVTEVTNEYNTDNRIIRQTHADGGVFTFSYNAAGGNIVETTMTEPNGAATTWGFYDHATRSTFHEKYITYKTTPDGTTVYERNQQTNQILSVIDPLGRSTTYTYWPTGQVKTMTDNLGNITSYEYENLYGLPAKVTDAAGKFTTINYTFDAQQRLTKAEITDPLLKVTTVNYNANGTVSSVKDPNQNTTSFFYENRGRPSELTRITDALGNSVVFGYDSLGRRISTTDAKGKSSYYGYDLMDRLIETMDPLMSITGFRYGLSGNLLTLTDAKGRTTRYSYDMRDRLTAQTDPLGRQETYTYDQSDNLRTRTDRKGQVTTYDYDLMNRLRSVTWHDGSTTQYTYDAGGRLTTITDSLSGTISYEYEGSGCTSGCAGFPDRITRETTSASGGGVVSYTYDALGRRATMTVAGHPPQAEPVNYGYFDSGLLREIRQVVNGVERKFSFEYDNAGRRTGVKYLPGGASVPVMETTYGYDNADRLLNISHMAGTTTLENLVYEYDANGARTRFTRNATQPVRGDSASPTCGTTDYTFDVRGRLIGISGFDGQCNPLTASFRYDALGRRYEKTVNGITTRYVYDGLDIVQEIQNGTVTANYIRTMNIDEPLMRIKSDGTMRFYKTDALGSVVQLTDENGAVKTTYAYDPFGNATISGEASDNPFQFAGRENDGTGLLYERNRYYSWEQMRYISEDPIGFAGGDVNLFVRVGNNPVNFVDPLGLHAVGFSGTGVLVANDNGNPVAYYPATSGLPGYMDPKYQYERDKGPIPSGSYTMYPNQFTGGQLKSLIWNLMGLFGIRGGGDWGTWRVPLHPDAGTNIGNRTGGFFIHGGMFPGSKGCIDIGSNDTDFHNLLKNHKGPVKVIIFYPGLFIIPIRKLKRRRLSYFAANGFILGVILSAIYQAYILIANWKWTPPEPWFVTYMKGFFILLFVISVYGRPLYFYWKHTALISKKEFMISWATAWLIFCIYLTVEVFFIHHSKVTPDEIIQLLTLLKDNTIFHYKLLIWTNIAGLFLKEIVWKFFLGNLISSIILLPFIIYIYKRKEYDGKR